MLYLVSFLSLFLLTGMVPQAIGFYLTFLAVPFVLYWRKELGPEMRRRLRRLSFGLFLMWVIFPITNFYNYVQNSTVTIPFKVLMKSHFCSSFVITAVCLFFFSLKDAFRRKSRFARPRLELEAPLSSSLIDPFLRGLMIASTLLCFYILFQQIWGMDFLGHPIPEARQMGGGFFRVSGFYSHPLTLAAVGLSVFGFVGTLLMQNKVMYKSTELLALLVMSAYFVFASGGRIATLILAFFGILILLVNYLAPRRSQRLSLKGLMTKFLVFSISLTLVLIILHQIGFLSRFSNLSSVESPDFERLHFWQVHWRIFLDNPWFGQGLALLNSFKRNEYYELLGFGSLQNKYAAHNMFLEVLSNVGIFGMLVILFGAREVWKSLQSKSYGDPIYARAFLVAFALNFINGLTQNVFFDSSVMYIYLSLIMLIIWSDVSDSLKGTPRHYTAENRQAIVPQTSSN